MSGIVLLLFFSLVVPLLVSAAMIDRHSSAWVPKLKREVEVHNAGAGAFRSTTVENSRWKLVGNGLPVPVFISSFVSFVLGQMWVPGLLLALLGGLFMSSNEYRGHGWWMPAFVLSSIPGTLVAIEQFRVGLALFRGRRAEADRLSKRSLRHVLLHNAVLIGLASIAMLTRQPDGRDAIWVAAAAAPFILCAVFARAVFLRYQERFTADDPDAIPALPAPVAAPLPVLPEQPVKVVVE